MPFGAACDYFAALGALNPVWEWHSSVAFLLQLTFDVDRAAVSGSFLIADFASELALFAAAGFLLFALDDLAVDLVYLARRLWRASTVYTRYPRAFAGTLAKAGRPGRMAVFVPAWDEGPVIAEMLRSTLIASASPATPCPARAPP